MSNLSKWGQKTGSHPRHAKLHGAQLFGICFRAHGQALRQHGAGVARVDHAIVQQQARGVKRIGLRVEQRHDLVKLRLSDSAGSAVSPLRAKPASATICMVLAACSPPMTAVLAFGQLNKKRGW